MPRSHCPLIMSQIFRGNQPDVVPLQNMDLIGSLFQIRVKFASVIICSARSLDSLWFRPWFLTNRLKLLKLRWDIFRWNVTHTLVLSNRANIKISVDARLCVYSITFTFTICCKALVQFKLNGQYCFTPIEDSLIGVQIFKFKIRIAIETCFEKLEKNLDLISLLSLPRVLQPCQVHPFFNIVTFSKNNFLDNLAVHFVYSYSVFKMQN